MPGVTAGVAAPAYAGIPVTQRGVSAAVAFVTGHEDPAKPDTLIDWPALAALPRHARLLHGRAQPRSHRRAAVAGGPPRASPSPSSSAARSPTSAPSRGTLRDIAAVAADAGVKAPAITVVGDVAALHGELAWFGAGPLAGRSVAVTRARAQASPLAARLRALGASVVEAPAIRIEPLAATLPDLGGFDLLCVTSPNGARRLLELCRDARDLRGPAIAAIGPGTADALRAGGIEADIVPRARGRRVARRGARRPAGDGGRSSPAPSGRATSCPDALRERGAEVEILPLYRTVAEPLSDDARAAALGADYVTFTSASAVRFFVEAAGRPDGPRARLDRADHERRRCASTGSSRTSRRRSTRRTASSPRCSQPPAG